MILPRNVACAACEGGGCDTCGRAGAVSLRKRGEPPEVLSVPVPSGAAGEVDVCLRIGARGGRSDDPDLPRGNLLLIVRWGEEPSEGVSLSRPVAPARVADGGLIGKVVVAGLALCVLFYLMLRLSGWL